MVNRVSSYQATVPSQRADDTPDSHDHKPKVGPRGIPSSKQQHIDRLAWMAGVALLVGTAAGCAIFVHTMLATPLVVTLMVLFALLMAGLTLAVVCSEDDSKLPSRESTERKVV